MLNKVTLIGRLGKDPETKNLTNGSSVVNFSIATTEKYKDKTTGEQKEVTEWHNLELWDGLGKIAAQYLKKGSLAYFEGKIKSNSVEKDGVKQYFTKIQVSEMKMLGGGTGGNTESNTYSATESKQEAEPVAEKTDDLPF